MPWKTIGTWDWEWATRAFNFIRWISVLEEALALQYLALKAKKRSMPVSKRSWATRSTGTGRLRWATPQSVNFTTRLTFRNANFAPNAVTAGVQSSDPTVLTGFGAQYFWDEENGIRLEYENFGTVGSGDCGATQACTGRANAKMASINLIFKF